MAPRSQQVGVVIHEGPNDWTVLQQDTSGHATLALAGEVIPLAGANANTGMMLSDEALAPVEATSTEGAVVEVRVVAEGTGAAVVVWAPAATDGLHWSAELRLPAGGLYRLETRLRVLDPESAAAKLGPRGDTRHFLGVGDVWAIAGQSNSSGYGRGPVEDPPELGVHLFNNANEWGLASHPMNDSTNTAHSLNREGGNPGHSPFLQFGRVLQRELGHPIGLLQVSLGGSPLSVWEEGAALHNLMVECTEAAGCNGLAGVLWIQGETDAGSDGLTTSYLSRFNAALASWRTTLPAPATGGLLCVTAQLNRVKGVLDPEQHRRWTALRNAQRLAASGSERRKEGVAIVPTFDGSLTDGIHNSPAANLTMGARMATAALGLRGQGIHAGADLAPEAVSAEILPGSSGGGTVEGGGYVLAVKFAHVPTYSRMGCTDPLAVAFRLEDDAGEVKITRCVYPSAADDTGGHDMILLQCGRQVTGQALLHGAYGCDPDTVPWDVERTLPMLGFMDLPVRFAAAGAGSGSRL